MPSPAHNVSMVESERNFTFNFGGFVSESKSPPLFFSGLIVGVLRDVGAGGGAGETKLTEPAWMKGVSERKDASLFGSSFLRKRVPRRHHEEVQGRT